MLPDASLPWLAIAGLGALHGLSPANGWLFVAARATQRRDRRDVGRALFPLACGHAASVLLVVAVVMQGMALDRARLQLVGGVVLLALAAWRLIAGKQDRASHEAPGARRPATALAMWSCLMGTAQGSGLMLVPALVPLCVSSGPAGAITASGSFLLMLGAVVLHLLAMLFTTHLVAIGVCRGLRARRLDLQARYLASLWTLLLALTGAALIVTR